MWQVIFYWWFCRWSHIVYFCIFYWWFCRWSHIVYFLHFPENDTIRYDTIFFIFFSSIFFLWFFFRFWLRFFFFFLIFYYYYFLLLKFYLALAFFAACDITSVIHSVLVLSTYYDIKSQSFSGFFPRQLIIIWMFKVLHRWFMLIAFRINPICPKCPKREKNSENENFSKKSDFLDFQ